eukprot:TRINITY_DN9063_c0_g1_i1.p1 TRINITY_DN9063_c0_g1~~TRINITY_DN9063_c0_g1_i1.p1  ORF type:complete len:548 (-),score=199.62 TRINITY_DN9063_c0_g1_i1:1541-3076(-)
MEDYFKESQCPWTLGTKDKDPHTHKTINTKAREGIMDTVLEAIGNTPLVRLNKIKEKYGLECDLLAKCEFFNSGGSVKDRIGFRMVADAEESGRIKPGDTLIEPTSGNTGIGLALAAAIKGYRMIITLPEKMSSEKVAVLKALGAEIIRTPTEAAFDSPESHIGVALRLLKEIPNSHILDQYKNPSNPLAHYDGTAEEILAQTGGKVDMIVMGAGTGGTISGVARKIKEKLPSCQIVGVDPIGSILAQPEELNVPGPSYHIEGIGYDFIPRVLDRSVIDKWVKSEDKESFLLARQLIREEGLLCGGSSGTALYGALQAAKDLKKGQTCVIVLPDSIRNYLSKFVTNAWMVDHGFLEEEEDDLKLGDVWWSKHTVGQLSLEAPHTIAPTVTCKEAVEILKTTGFDQLPVVSDGGEIMGVVTQGNLTAKLVRKKIKPTDAVSAALFKGFKTLKSTTPLSHLASIFERDTYALVVTTQKNFGGDGSSSEKSIVSGIVTGIDLLNYISANDPDSH